jgi:Tfp pilus assembly protein PilF
VQQAIDDYEKALELDPDLDEARTRLAENLIHSQRVGEALPHFEQLHAKHPEDLRVRIGLAECYTKRSALAEARDLLDAVLDEMPGDSPRAFYAMTLRASLAMLMDQPVDAERWSRKALALAPDSQENLYNLYHSLDLLERHEEARVYEAKWRNAEDETRKFGRLMERVAGNPDDPAPQHEMGVIYLHQGRDDLGLMWLVSALQADPSYRPTLLALAEYYEKKGDEVRVKEFRRRAEVDAAPMGDDPGAPKGNR